MKNSSRKSFTKKFASRVLAPGLSSKFTTSSFRFSHDTYTRLHNGSVIATGTPGRLSLSTSVARLPACKMSVRKATFPDSIR
jgi:hypothetical protein